MTDVEAAAPPPDATKVDAALITESPEHWPALSDSVRTPARSDSFKALSLGSAANMPPQGKVGIENEAPVNSMPKPNPPPHSPTNVGTNRQNSMNRVGGNLGRINSKGVNSKWIDGGLSQVQSAPGSPSVLSNSGSSSSVGEPSVDGSRKNAAQRNEQQPFRRSHSGPLYGRGDNRGNTRDQDRRRRDLGSRSFGSRENHSQQQHQVGRVPPTRGPAPAPYAHYQVHPVYHGPQMVYPGQPFFVMPAHLPDFQSRPVTMIPQMPFPMPDPDLSSQILKQIEYYFSDDNLVKDWFLRNQMDGEGWIPISLVAGFPKVKQLTENVQLIMETLRASNAVEVQGDKLRRKTDWARWITRQSKAT